MGHILEAFPHNVASAMGRPAAPHHPIFYGENVDNQQQGWSAAGAGSPFSNTWVDGSSGAGSWAPPGQGVYQATGVESGTESDTSSDDWDAPLDAAVLSAPPADEEAIYWQYSQAKRAWR